MHRTFPHTGDDRGCLVVTIETMDQITLAIGQLLDTFIQRGLTGHQFIGQPDRFDRQLVEEFFAEGQSIPFRRPPVFEYLVPGDTKRPRQEVGIRPKCGKTSP